MNKMGAKLVKAEIMGNTVRSLNYGVFRHIWVRFPLFDTQHIFCVSGHD